MCDGKADLLLVKIKNHPFFDPPADAGEAEGGQQAEHDPAAEHRAQRSAPQSSGGCRHRHQNPGGGASAASAEGEKQKRDAAAAHSQIKDGRHAGVVAV